MKTQVLFLILMISHSIFGQVIVIDPGHGYCADCTQNCTSNVRSDLEIQTSMSVGNKLVNLFQNCSSVTTHLTRTTSNCGDFPSLYQRATMSNNWNADRFLSIHCNAGGGNGTETFWCNNSSSSNASCQSFAEEVQSEMVSQGQWNDRRVVEDHSYLNFHLGVLHPTNAIGCLNEIAFVDYPPNATKLTSNTWRNTFAAAYKTALENDLGINCSSASLDCSSAVTLTCGVSYHGPSSSAASNVYSYGCNSWTETGPERVHTITPQGNGTLTATISNFSGDLDVYLLGSCDPSDCLGTVSGSSVTFPNAIAGQTYYLVVDADDGSNSAYDIIVSCPAVPTYPDVNIQALNSNPAAPVAGQSVNLYTTIKNIGTASANNIVFTYKINGTTVATDNHASLNPGQYVTETTPFTFPSAGTYQLCMYLTGISGETNTSNNSYCRNITVTAPASSCPDSFEPNETIATAYSFGSNNSQAVSGLCLIAQDHDYFKININAKVFYIKVSGYSTSTTGDYNLEYSVSGNKLTIKTLSHQGSTTDTYLRLYNSSSNLVANNDDGGAGYFSKIVYTLPNTCDQDYLEPNNNSSLAHNIGSSTTFSNAYPLCITSNDFDFFKFTHASKTYYIKCKGYSSSSVGMYNISFSINSNTVTIETSSNSGSNTDTYLYLLNSSLQTIAYNDDGGAGYFSKITKYLNSSSNKNGHLEEVFEAEKAIEVNLYPNPVLNTLTLETFKDNNIEAYRIYNTQGQLIDFNNKKINVAKMQINVSEFKKGVYYIKMKVNGKEVRKNFIKN